MEEPADEILRFIRDRIDTVPQIEALLLLWEQRPTALSVQQVASMLFVSEETSAGVLRALEQRRLAARVLERDHYRYDSSWEPDGDFMARVAATYRRHLIRVATLIHSKASPSVLEFARAFESKKDR